MGKWKSRTRADADSDTDSDADADTDTDTDADSDTEMTTHNEEYGKGRHICLLESIGVTNHGRGG